MRLIEALLAFANLLTFLVIAVPGLAAARWKVYVIFITLAIAGVQVLLEGPRWQMAPAYVLTGLFVCVWMVQSFAPVRRVVKQRQINRSVAGFAVILCIICMVLSVALPILLPVFGFPRPSGPFGIGTVTYHWTDSSRREVFSPGKQMPRELMVQVWYPARKDASSSHSRYLPDADAVSADFARLAHFPYFFLSHLKYVMTNASESAPVADDQPRYPVLIFLEGRTGYRQMNTFQIEELVSHGYIVAGIDQPGVASAVVFPDGHHLAGLPRDQIEPLTEQSLSPTEHAPQFNGQKFKDGIIPYFAQDVSFTLDQLAALNSRDPKRLLTGKLDLAHIGMFGISFGGMVGAEACLKDSRLGSCLMMDVAMTTDVVQKGLRQPSMWITRPAYMMRLERQTAGGWTEQDIEQTQTTMREVYNRLPGDGYFVQVSGMFHIDFTDLDLLSPIAPAIGFSGPIGSPRAHEIVNAYSLAFFDRHLKSESVALLDEPSAHYPEVIFQKRAP